MKKAFLIFLLITLMRVTPCFSVSSAPIPKAAEGPWFTGPLLTPSARVMPKGQINLEPYLFWNVTTGIYDDNWHAHSVPTFNEINAQVLIKYGIADKIDLTLLPQSSLSFTRGRIGSSFGDFPVGLSYQLFEGKPEDWITFIRFSITEIFPTGKYNHLDPDLLLTDVGGQGSFTTVTAFTFSKLFEFPCKKYLGLRWNVAVSYHAPTRIRGFSIFGGDENTRGTIHHGASYLLLIGAEYSVTQEFALACDFFARYVQRKTFKGFTNTPISKPELIQMSLAPAFEYNWSPTMGIIVGTWFTITGRNAARFISGVAAFNYLY